MHTRISTCRLELVAGDITTQDVDAVVNAANERLAGGGGVDGAIHRAAGPGVMAETDRDYPNGCPTGSAVISGAGRLRAKSVIHAVGPVWAGGRSGEESQLRSAYRSSLRCAVDAQAQSVAFPAISCGVFGYPLDLAAMHSLSEVIAFLEQHEKPSLVRFVLFSEGVFGAYARALEALLTDRDEPK